MPQMEAVQKLKAMKPGQQFTVDSKRDRATLLNTAKTLRNAGVIEFQLVTRANDSGGFIIAAIAV